MKRQLKQTIQLKLILFLLCMPIIVSNFTIAKADEFPFEVEAVIPESQVDKTKTSFDLKLENGQEQTLEVILRNTTKKELTVETTFNRLSTNSNGIIEYSGSGKKADTSLKLDIEKLITVKNKQVVIKGLSEEKVKVVVQAPDKEFPGIIAGGLTFSLLNEKEKNKESTDKDMVMTNEYGYEVGLVLHGNVPVDKILSEFNLTTVSIRNTNGRNRISANLQNPQPKVLNDMVIATKVVEKKTGDIFLENTKDGIRVAPNTNFDYSIPLEGALLTAGEYTLELTVTADSGNWKLAQEFSVEKAQAELIHKENKPVVRQSTSKLVFYVLTVMVVVSAVSLLVYSKLKKKRKAKKSRNEIKKRKKRIKK